MHSCLYACILAIFHTDIANYSYIICLCMCTFIHIAAHYAFKIFCSAFIISAAFSAIIITGALVFPDTIRGIMKASTTRSPSTSFTHNLGSTTVLGSSTDPIFHVPTGWYTVRTFALVSHSRNSSVP